MSYEEIDIRVQKSKKSRFCIWCGESIPTGAAHVYRVYKFDGDFHADRVHLECLEGMKRSDWDDYESEGFEEGMFDRGKTVQETEEREEKEREDE